MNPIDGIETKDNKSFADVLADKVVKDTDKEKETFLGGILGPKFDKLMNDFKKVVAVLTGKEIVSDSTETETNIQTNTSETRASNSPESRTSILGDMTILRSQYPKEAWSKCNNPAGITWNENFANPKPGKLAHDLQEAGIPFHENLTGRGPGEGGNYVGFNTMDDGLKAMVVLRDRSAKNGRTITHRLKDYAGVPYSIPGIDASKRFDQLTRQEKNHLLMGQIKLESGGLRTELDNKDTDFLSLGLV